MNVQASKAPYFEYAQDQKAEGHGLCRTRMRWLKPPGTLAR